MTESSKSSCLASNNLNYLSVSIQKIFTLVCSYNVLERDCITQHDCRINELSPIDRPESSTTTGLAQRFGHPLGPLNSVLFIRSNRLKSRIREENEDKKSPRKAFLHHRRDWRRLTVRTLVSLFGFNLATFLSGTLSLSVVSCYLLLVQQL